MMIIEPVNARASWWPCWSQSCVSGLGRLEQTELSEKHTRVGPYAQMWLRHKRAKLGTASLLITCIGESFIGTNIFHT